MCLCVFSRNKKKEHHQQKQSIQNDRKLGKKKKICKINENRVVAFIIIIIMIRRELSMTENIYAKRETNGMKNWVEKKNSKVKPTKSKLH